MQFSEDMEKDFKQMKRAAGHGLVAVALLNLAFYAIMLGFLALAIIGVVKALR